MSSKACTFDDLFELPDRPQIKLYDVNDMVVTNVVLNKTPVSILEEGGSKIFDCPVKFSVVTTEKDNIPLHTTTCQIATFQTQGSGTSKKVGKQQAASKMILLLLQKKFSYAEKLGLNFSTYEEVSTYLEQFCTENDTRPDSSDFVPSRNYLGILNETCKKNKLSDPTFVQMEEGPPNERIFTTICQVNDVSVKGQAKQKKQSKSLACYEMLNKIENGEVVSQECDEEEELPKPESVSQEVPKKTRRDSERTLEDCLEKVSLSKERTIVKKEFKMLDESSTCGARHCLLKIELQSGDSKSTVIFPGRGDTEEEARKCAAKEASLHFSTA